MVFTKYPNAVMKPILTTPLIAMVLIAALTGGGCTDAPPPPQKDNPNPEPCTQTGTIQSSICGTGIWNNLWIVTDEGQWLRPQSTTLTVENMPEAGQRVRFSARKVDYDPSWDTVPRCLATIPAHQNITVTCLQMIPEDSATVECNKRGRWTKLQPSDVPEQINCGGWVIATPDSQYLKPFPDVEEVPGNPTEGQAVRFSYEHANPTFWPCDQTVPVTITCWKADNETSCTPVIYMDNQPMDSAQKDVGGYQIRKAWLEDTYQLRIIAAWSGGCQEPQFGLHAYRNSTTEFPSTLSLRLFRQVADPCQAYLTDTFCFDLEAAGRRREEQVYLMNHGLVE